MKQSARRLGRGLGAFLDFGPAGGETAAYAPGTAEEGAKSVLETSAPAPRPAQPPAPAGLEPAPRVLPAPPAPRVEREPVQAREIAPENAAFVDEIVGGLTFPDVELE